MKVCTKCKEEKESIQFHKDRYTKDGLKSGCKCCVKIYCDNNRDSRINNKKKWLKLNKEYANEYRKEHYQINKERVLKQTKAYTNNKLKTNSLFKLRSNISSNIYGVMKKQGYCKNTKTYKILGCSFEHFKSHLERQFTKGMCWENQGEWHLDHIYPVSLAKDEEELIKLNHYTNFQPLWAIDNIKKGNKIIEKQLTLI